MMVVVNNQGYIQGRGRTEFIIRHNDRIGSKKGQVNLGECYFPPHLIGRKVSFKIELSEYEEKKDNE